MIAQNLSQMDKTTNVVFFLDTAKWEAQTSNKNYSMKISMEKLRGTVDKMI